jgi:hypothetical protein
MDAAESADGRHGRFPAAQGSRCPEPVLIGVCLRHRFLDGPDESEGPETAPELGKSAGAPSFVQIRLKGGSGRARALWPCLRVNPVVAWRNPAGSCRLREEDVRDAER